MAGRRSNNEGSIFQRKSDKRWVVQISINGETKPYYRKTEDEAVELLKQFHHQQIIGKNISASDEPLEAYAGRWMYTTVKNTVRQNTWEDYAALLKNHILPVLGKKSIGTIQTADVQGLYDKMFASGSSPQIIRKVHVLLGRCFRSMLPDRLIDRDPTIGTRRPKIIKKKKILFTPEQEALFIETVTKSTSQFADMLKVYWEVGGRTSEIIGLKWSAVGDDYIQIENVRVQVIGGSIDSVPKTASSNRKVYLTPECIAAIKKQPRKAVLDENGAPKVDSKKNTVMSEYVFCTASGKPHSQRNWRRQWDQWLITAFGIDTERSKYIKDDDGKTHLKYPVPAVSITPHATRHMQAVKMFQAGWTVADVQTRGGWDSPRVLQEIYAAHSAEDRQKAMAQTVKFGITVTTTVNDEKSSPAEAEEL